jgi:hypothetical protein
VEVAPPEIWEDHIAHWESHTKIVQSRQFKEEVDSVARASMLEHLRITEIAMFDKAEKNPEFDAQLARLVNFPINIDLLQVYQAPMSMEHRIALGQGQANMMGETSVAIPGTPVTEE